MPRGFENGPSQHEISGNYIKTTVLPGRKFNEGEEYAGEPMAYFVRTEGSAGTLETEPGSLEEMMQKLFGAEAMDFIAGMNSPSDMKNAAEKLKDKINNPEIQEKIRDLFTKIEELHKEIYDR